MPPFIFISRMGGKSRVANEIIDLFPDDYSTFIEPFAGGAKVFLALEKKPQVHYILNDKNKDIYHLWKDAQTVPIDRVKSFQFDQSKKTFDFLKQQTNIKNKVHRFYRNLYLSFFSFSGLRVAFARKPATKGQRFINQFDRLQDHLKGVTILNQDYKKVIQKYDSPSTFFYLDPPYVEMERYYEGQSIDPFELAEVCRSIKGKFILSYNITPQVKEAFQNFQFKKLKYTYTSSLSSKQQSEYIIMNY